MPKLSDLSVEQQTALRTQVLPDWTDQEINFFLLVCDSRGVSPFAGRVYGQRRMDNKSGKYKCSVMPTIDGSREAAARTGDYAGSSEPEYDGDDAPNPAWCRITVFRKVKGEKCAFTAKVRWAEFKPQAPNDFQWKAKPYHMLAKVAEQQALRKAFPELVTSANEDEYAEDIEENNDSEAQKQAEEKSKLALRWQQALQALKALGKDEAAMLTHVKIESKDQATDEHLQQLFEWYQSIKNAPENTNQEKNV